MIGNYMCRVRTFHSKRIQQHSFPNGLDLSRATIVDVGVALRNGAVSAEDVTAWSIKRTEQAHARFNCLAGSTSDHNEWRVKAEQAAIMAGQRFRQGEPLSALDGIPMTVKDNFCVKDMTTTACSNILGSWRPPFNAAAVESLEFAGAVVTGKSNHDEFG
jgi:aspartyl-tRNA(Asn)/glutamyl-tRNA(Gln) amidotransferase subunit A